MSSNGQNPVKVRYFVREVTHFCVDSLIFFPVKRKRGKVKQFKQTKQNNVRKSHFLKTLNKIKEEDLNH